MTTPYQPRAMSAPTQFPEHEAFWAAARDGRLLVPRCQDCGKSHWYPRPICPLCGSDRTQWVPARGFGEVYSVSVTRKAGPVPYAIAYVKLDEGPIMMTNIVDCDLDEVRIGDRVEVIFRATEGGPPVPVFRPCRSA